MAEVQPVLDKHCVRCHDFGRPENGNLVLAGDREMVFNVAYTELWSKGMVHCVGAGPAAIQPARSWGAAASPLIRTLDRGHHDVALSAEEMERLVTWLDLNGPYYPSYLTAYPAGIGGRAPLTPAQVTRLGELTGVDLAADAAYGRHRVWGVFDRPELSPLLERFDDSRGAAYAEVLAILRAGRAVLLENPRGDTAGFTPCATDQARDARYARRAAVEASVRAAIREGRKVYDPGVSR